MSRDLIFRDTTGTEYQPVKHFNRKTGRSAYRVKPVGASNETDDCIELDSIDDLARAMLVDGLPARVKSLSGGPVNYLKFGAQKLVSYHLAPDIAERIGVAATSGAHPTQADQIRMFVKVNVIDPARNRGEKSIEIVSGDIHRAMGLSDALPAVCSALESKAFAELADAKLEARHSPIGSEKPSSTIRYEFALNGSAAVVLDRIALARLKANFLSLHADFVSFNDCPSFAAREGDYKRALVVEAERLLRTMAGESDENLGEALIELLAGRAEFECNLIDWRAQKVIDNARKANPAMVEAAVGSLARAEDAIGSVATFIETVWPVMRGDLPSNPYAESRMFPTMLRGLVDPQSILPIRSTPTDNAARMLLGRPAFGSTPLTREELSNVTNMAREIMRIMDDEWNWSPRDMWDVQGFIWETCQRRPPENTDSTPSTSAMEQLVPTTNLILYGPPGTGKTYISAWEAVRLCLGEAAAAPLRNDRDALMAEYRRLASEGRIEFITFHQSFSYEDFVEGLRPTTRAELEGDQDQDAGVSAGFSLKPHAGIFKLISERARLDTGDAPTQRLDRSKHVYKIALGQRGSEEYRIKEGLERSLIHLGWGGDIDWSDERFDDFEEIRKEWNEKKDPDASGKDPNIEMTYAFRSGLQVGDYVVISDGRDSYRAFGQVTGEYWFDSEADFHPHRRSVKWVWRDDKGAERDTFYPRYFRRQSAYRLDSDGIDWDALEAVVIGPNADRPVADARPHVLIIDEINRANISKVFGELITLLEVDKRLGCENEVRVRLPYSGTSFGVPSNLHIIGTMNTADRSIALLDTALRRRFTFRELMPEPDRLGTVGGIDLRKLLATLNERIEYLFDREHQIGHAYFIGCSSKSDVDEAMRHKVIPLLTEYFYEDWGKVAAVLGDADDGAGDRNGRFLDRRRISPPPGLSRDNDLSDRYRWEVRKELDFSEFIAG